MKPRISTFLAVAVSCLVISEPCTADEPVLIGQPTIFWRNGEWQTYKNGVWAPYGKTPAADQAGGGKIVVVGGIGPTTFRIGQPNAQIGQTTIGVGQPQGQIGQTTIGIGQPNGQIGQTTVAIGQRSAQIGQTTIGIGQPNGQIGQTTIGIGQSSGQIGQTTIGIGQPNGQIGQTTIGIGQPSGTASASLTSPKPVDVSPEPEKGTHRHGRR